MGAPVLEAELCVGDVLYMPRGTIHQAAADGASDSDHLTISTYQRSSYADLATHLLQVRHTDSSKHVPDRDTAATASMCSAADCQLPAWQQAAWLLLIVGECL